MSGESVDVQERLDELTVLVEEAKAMPLSASCILNRSPVLDVIEEIRQLMPESVIAPTNYSLTGRQLFKTADGKQIEFLPKPEGQPMHWYQSTRCISRRWKRQTLCAMK